MAWFEINGNHIVSHDYVPWNEDNGAVWGLYIGGRWHLDYTWKLMLNISTDDWNNRCSSIKTHKDFYDFCEWLGVYYDIPPPKVRGFHFWFEGLPRYISWPH